MEIHNVEQKSPEWFALRKKHCLTASAAQAIGNNGKGLETLCWEKMSEKYSSGIVEQFSNKHTDRGNDLEPDARALYELETSNTVTEVGFVTDDSISPVGGASPDSLVNEDGLLEIKCFADAKHFKLIADFKKTGKFEIESQYLWQMNQQMLFTGRKWVDFLAYNPNYTESLLIQRVEWDEEKIAKIKEGLKKGEEIIKGIEASL
ncbi:MAG: lambda exonuclease family protein [Minisyncoccia bacterium]